MTSYSAKLRNDRADLLAVIARYETEICNETGIDCSVMSVLLLSHKIRLWDIEAAIAVCAGPKDQGYPRMAKGS